MDESVDSCKEIVNYEVREKRYIWQPTGDTATYTSNMATDGPISKVAVEQLYMELGGPQMVFQM